MILLEPNEINFPNPRDYHPIGGLVAQGGNLSVPSLIRAYRSGIFPWHNPEEEILWWCPDPRFVLFPREIIVSKSMKKVFKNNEFEFTENQNFFEVISQCKSTERKDQDGTWITDDLISSFVKLHEMGLAKSVEVWKDDKLVGGLYGIQIGSVFCGESMFSTVSNASKAGFIYFVIKNLNALKLIDCQAHTEHLESLGARFISKNEFLDYISS